MIRFFFQFSWVENIDLKWKNVETYALILLSYIFKLIGNAPANLKLRLLKWLLFKWP